ncbi:MAG: hypothetical protein KatS3mg082_3346 [Nitrospiraceae bacterium]|nr:MAG: hypothetical protein KatS3mg082_3346 [Nitrospiraceae bacterium]
MSRESGTDYWDSLHRAHPGQFAAVGYSALGEGFNREAYRRLRFPALRALLIRQGVRPRTLLEAGVGTGAYARLWRELGVTEWVGVDISGTAVATLRTRFPKGEFYVLDLARPGPVLGSRTFDLVTAIDVLYHIVADEDFETALVWLARRVGPRGHLVVSDVFTDSPWGRRFPHVKRRPMVAYQGILEPLGLRLVDREPVFSILGDSVPDGSVRGRMLYEVWRVIQKSIRMMPERFRSAYGAGVVRILFPFDRTICRLIDSRGIVLELAIFGRT